ncbi:MAG: hypothetical protein IKL06_00940 [Lachnospiraceae bacterium]|nr:hypothetical protein [Lachnospiraceae bacterium]
MKLNTLGQFLRFYREKYSFRQDKVCSGICSVATLSKVENGSKIIDSLAAECLLGRIGKEVLQFEILLNDNDYYLWRNRCEIQKLLENEKFDELRDRIGLYRKQMPQEDVHEQFCLFYEAQAAIKERKASEEICEMLYGALKLTKPEMDSGNEENILYNSMEIKLILQLIHYNYPMWEDRDKESELLKLFHYTETVYTGRQKEKTGVEILLELINFELVLGKDLHAIAYVDKAVTLISQGRGIENIAELHFIKAKAIERVYHEKVQWKEMERVCKEECLMAYYVFDILGQESEKMEVQQFCEGKLEWQIIE